MKKKINILLAFAAAGVLAACGTTDNGGTTSSETTTSETTTSQGTTTSEAADSSVAEESSVEAVETDWSINSTVTGDYSVTVWAAEEILSLTQQQCNEFASTYTGGTLTITVTAQGEGDAAEQMLNDVSSGADVYCFAQDQFSRLVLANALSAEGGKFATAITSNNDSGAVAAATSGDTVYAFPLTSDNGYFLYYDKSVISDEQAQTWEGIIEACSDAGKYINLEYGSAWYNAGFFFGTGCVSEWTVDNTGAFTDYNDTYNSDEGLVAGKFFKTLIDSNVCVNNSGAGSAWGQDAGCLVSGTWDYSTTLTALGDNLGCAKLPTFTVDGTTYQTGSYSGNKLMGVKPHDDTSLQNICNNLAGYLTDYEQQLARFNSNAWGPSNKEAAASDDVQANPGLAALAAQNEYAVPQGQIPGTWWDVAGALPASIAASDGSDDAIKGILETYAGQLSGMLTA